MSKLCSIFNCINPIRVVSPRRMSLTSCLALKSLPEHKSDIMTFLGQFAPKIVF